MAEGDSHLFRARAQARVGAVLRGKYRLDRVLGIGGMAVVYKATHRNRAELAIKMLHPEVSLNADIRARFLREGYAANSIKHPGVVAVVDDDIAEDGAAFLVMELLDGFPCDALWDGGERRLAPELASAIVLQLLDVLAAAHERGIVHRDIKPANLFLTHAGLVKVLDFGIARVREAMAGGSHATGTGMTLGTPAFMSPEHARGISRELDGRTDLWAAGATFFSLVSGQLVHAGAETSNDLLIRAATTPARSLASVAPEVPAPVSAVIDRALVFAKDGRWPSAGAMKDALLHAHRECFGGKALEAVVAAAVQAGAEAAAARARVEGEASGDVAVTGGAPRTRTAPLPEDLGEARPTGTLPPASIATQSTSSPMARDGAPHASSRTRAPTPRLVIRSLIALGALAAGGIWLTRRVPPTAPRGGDAADATPAILSDRDAARGPHGPPEEEVVVAPIAVDASPAAAAAVALAPTASAHASAPSSPVAHAVRRPALHPAPPPDARAAERRNDRLRRI